MRVLVLVTCVLSACGGEGPLNLEQWEGAYWIEYQPEGDALSGDIDLCVRWPGPTCLKLPESYAIDATYGCGTYERPVELDDAAGSFVVGPIETNSEGDDFIRVNMTFSVSPDSFDESLNSFRDSDVTVEMSSTDGRSCQRRVTAAAVMDETQ